MSTSTSAEIDPPFIRASLIIRKFGLDPKTVTKILGIPPSRSGQSGDERLDRAGQPTGRKIGQTFWSLDSRLGSDTPLANQLDDIIEQLGDASTLISELAPPVEISLRCTVASDCELPLLTLRSSQLLWLGRIAATLEIDVID